MAAYIQSQRGCLPLHAMVLLSAVSCSWIRQVPAPENPSSLEFQASEKPLYFEKTLIADNELQYQQLGELGELVLAADSELHAQGGKNPEPQEHACLQQPVQLRFAWYSDVHIRQRDVKLFSRNASSTLDHVINSFESDPLQEEFGWAAYLTHLLALNRYQAGLANRAERLLQFYIHTGDAIDAGTIEELYRFVHITNRLSLPWLNLVGNHDYSVFGNYQRSRNYSVDAGVAFYPIGQLRNFLHMHRATREISGFGPYLLPVPLAPDGKGHRPSLHGSYYFAPAPGGSAPGAPGRPASAKLIPGTSCHGFELRIPSRDASEDENCDSLPGYYAFDLDRGVDSSLSVRLRVIVLNSEEESRFGAGSSFGEAQLAWLHDMLHGAHDRTTLLFVHHRVKALPSAVLELLRAEQNGPIVVFSGHSHSNDVSLFAGRSGRSIYELNTGSLNAFPQVGRIIELRGQGPSGCLTSRAVWPRLLAAALPSLRPHALSEQHKIAMASCDANRLAVRKHLPQAVKCARLGALRDYQRTDVTEWGTPQDFEEAWDRMNIIIPLELAPDSTAPTAQH